METQTKRRIVDAHHHLWQLNACHYPWLMARGVKRFFGDPAPIQKDYLVRDYRADTADYELAGSVHIQVGVADGEALAETRWLEDQATASGLPSAIVAACDLSLADAPGQLAAQAKHPHVRGVRQIVGRSADEDAQTGSGRLLDDALWCDQLALLAKFDLSFDLQLVPGQLAAAADVFSQVPDLKVALCHCGSPWDQSARGIANWRHGLALMAQLPNAFCKISGLGMFDHRWTVASVTPLIESCIELFGVERCMFGSNFPVDKLHASFARVFCAFEAVTSALPEADLTRLFAGTATDFYRLDNIAGA